MRRDHATLEAEALGAALRYTAVADWFESRPVTQATLDRDCEAMALFNQVEDELRQAGRRLLRRNGNRALVLDQCLNGTAAR